MRRRGRHRAANPSQKRCGCARSASRELPQRQSIVFRTRPLARALSGPGNIGCDGRRRRCLRWMREIFRGWRGAPQDTKSPSKENASSRAQSYLRQISKLRARRILSTRWSGATALSDHREDRRQIPGMDKKRWRCGRVWRTGIADLVGMRQSQTPQAARAPRRQRRLRIAVESVFAWWAARGRQCSRLVLTGPRMPA